ncbi:MAG: biotin--[acetyl-CoA-carboxylase] ligase [Gallionella sp.]
MKRPDKSERTWQLLEILSDGKFHSGVLLGKSLGLSRASVFDALKDVASMGIALQRVRGRGYRLTQPWQKLKIDEILSFLGRKAGHFDMEILSLATSSNTLLLQGASSGAVSGSVLAVELQTAGRGRLGRTWHSGLGNALTFSLLWRFEKGLNALSGLSLTVGVAVVRALKKLGGQGVQLKWPNDILTEQGKLGGILIEAQGDMLGPSAVVIGIGLNYRLSGDFEKIIDQPYCSVDDACAEMPTRNQLLAMILIELEEALFEFAAQGFKVFRAEWEQYHAYQNRSIRMKMPDDTEVIGIASGINNSGELCLKTPQGLRYFNSGEVERAQ